MASYNLIGLSIPEQTAPQSQAFYLNEREIAEWVENLPLANLGETSRRLYRVLRDFNGAATPSMNRLAIADQLRNPVSYLGSGLDKHYLDARFPLSDKARKVALLNRQLQIELATAYKIAVNDMVLARQKKSDHQSLTTALHRAFHHLSRVLLLAVLVYDDFPKRIWLELHILHRLACRYDLQHRQLNDALETTASSFSIDRAYRRILLFYLASPYKKRQRENLQLYEALLEWSGFTRLYESDQAPTDAGVIVRQDSDLAPIHGSLRSRAEPEAVLRLDVSRLIDKLREQFDARPRTSPLRGIDSMDKSLIRQLIELWSSEQKRTFVRTRLNFELRVAVGIGNLYQIIQSAQAQAPDATPATASPWVEKSFTLGEDFQILSRFTEDRLVSTDQTGVRRNNFEAFGPSSREDDARIAPPPIWNDGENRPGPSETFPFRTLNESAGGYCLDWGGIDTPKILVGELIGVKSAIAEDQFSIGLIRWMKNARHENMQVGIQMIAPRALAVSARKSVPEQQPRHECLLLPAVDTVGQPASLLAPPYPFEVGDSLILDEGKHRRQIRLTRLLESSGAISQYQFIALDDSKSQAGTAPDEADEAVDFDNLWSTL